MNNNNLKTKTEQSRQHSEKKNQMIVKIVKAIVRMGQAQHIHTHTRLYLVF